MGKIDLWTQTILSVDTLGLVLRVFVTAANVGEREGGKRVLKRVDGKAVSRLHTIWVDGGFDGEPFMLGDGRLPLDCSGGAAPNTKGFVLLKNVG